MSHRWSAALGAAMLVAVATACGDDGSSKSTSPTPVPSGVPDNAQVATVVAQVDADTVRVALVDGSGSTLPPPGVEVSVIGVVRPGPGECLAAESDAFAGQELPDGATVYLVADAQDAGPDGILLRYVWDSDGDFYNDKLLRQGFARAAPSPPNERFREQLSGAESEAMAAGRGVWGCAAAPSSTPPATSAPTAPNPTTPGPTSPPATAPATTAPTVPEVPIGRTVALGETFSVGIGETVYVPAEGLSVTYSATVSDSRCRPGVQCIQAGDATIAVAVAKAGSPAASLSLNTDSPMSGQYQNYTVVLLRLTLGTPTIAGLRVT